MYSLQLGDSSEFFFPRGTTVANSRSVISAGSVVNSKLSVENYGDSVAPEAIVTIYLSDDGEYHSPDETDGIINEFIFSDLAPGSSRKLPKEIRIPDDTPGGNWRLVASLEEGTVLSTGVEVIPAFTVSDASAKEGDKLVFTVTLEQPSRNPVKLLVDTTGNGKATKGADYSSKKIAVKFDPGETTKTFSVSTKSDDLKEKSEKFVLKISTKSPGQQVEKATATIIDTKGGKQDSIAESDVAMFAGRDDTFSFGSPSGRGFQHVFEAGFMITAGPDPGPSGILGFGASQHMASLLGEPDFSL